MPITRSIAVTLSLCCVLFLPPASWAVESGREPIVVEDLHYGEVLFYFYQGDYFPAIIRLLAAQTQSNLDKHIDDSELLLGGM